MNLTHIESSIIYACISHGRNGEIFYKGFNCWFIHIYVSIDWLSTSKFTARFAIGFCEKIIFKDLISNLSIIRYTRNYPTFFRTYFLSIHLSNKIAFTCVHDFTSCAILSAEAYIPVIKVFRKALNFYISFNIVWNIC